MPQCVRKPRRCCSSTPPTPREVAFRYRHDEGFRSTLSNYWVWVDQRGLNGIDFHRIHNDGTMTKIEPTPTLSCQLIAGQYSGAVMDTLQLHAAQT